jgi:arylsulfatase A-like enzyme/Flp pilus assembly protein TadD
MGIAKRAQQNRTGQPPVSSRVSRRAIWIVAAAVIVAVGAAGAYVLLRGVPPGRGVAAPAGSPLNILLVTLDTTRADHLGCYGWGRARTPELDRLAREGVRFEWAFSPVPITLPAHASLMTGRYPFAHGVRNNGNFYLGDKFETLATSLHGRGYRTAAFVSSFVLDRRYGLQRGFDTYDDRMDATEREPGAILNLEAERRGDHTGAALDAWLTAYARQVGAPFFAWLHLYDPHEPYWPPQPFRDTFKDALYDGEIAFDDAVVGRLVERLGELGLLDRTLVAIVGDHGESLGDHGEETHGMFVYESAIRVPLILWRPDVVKAGVVVRHPVRVTDVAPTLLELVGAPGLPTPDGRSLRPMIEGRAGAAVPPIYAETLMPQLNMNWAPLRALRDERWKYIEAPRPELYDLAADPAENRNVHDERPQTVRGLRQALEQITGGAAGALAAGTMDRETLDKLASLGYVGAGAEAPPASAGSAHPDPKDMVASYNRLRRANTAIRERRFAEALPVLRDVLAQDGRNAFALVSLGGAYMALNDYRAAIAAYRRYLDLVPTSATVHGLIASCYEHLGDRQNVVREAEAALAIDPRFSDARVLKSAALAAQGHRAAALAEMKAAVDADPTAARLRFELGRLLGEAGEAEAAEAQYRAALELQPDYAPALAGLGTLYARTGRYELAAQMLGRAVTVAPRQDEARYNLATVYERLGRLADARAEYHRLATTAGTAPAVAAAARTRLAALERAR